MPIGGDFLNTNNPNCRQELFYIISFSSFTVYRKDRQFLHPLHRYPVRTKPVHSFQFLFLHPPEGGMFQDDQGTPLLRDTGGISLRNSAILTPS